MSSLNEGTAPPSDKRKPSLRVFIQKLRKRRIIETLAAFIGGGWLLVEVVERLLVGHYHFPERLIDLTVVSVVGALLTTLVWRWFSGREKPRKFKPERILIPLVILITVLVDINLALQLKGPESESVTRFSEKGGARLDPRLIVVAVFENQTGDPRLDPVGRMAADWIAQGLQQTGLVAVAPSPPDESTLGTKESKKRLGDIARETGAGTVVSGVYYLQGNLLRLQAQVTDERKGKLLAALDPVTGLVEDPTKPIELLRQKVMGTLAFVFDPKFKAVMGTGSQPPSYEAYLQYMEGIELFGKLKFKEAIGPLTRAAALDSAFQLPLIWIGGAHINLGEYREAEAVIQKLSKHRDELSPYNRNWLDLLKAWLSGDNHAAYRKCSQMTSLSPSELTFNIAGSNAMTINHPREALDFLKKCDPQKESMKGWTPFWKVLTQSYHMLGDHNQELKEARRGRKLYPELFSTLWNEIRALAALGRIEEVNKKIDESLTLPPERGWNPGEVMSLAGNQLRCHGYREASLQVLDRAIQWYQGRPPEEAKSEGQRYSLGYALYTAERLQEARALFEELLEEAPGNEEYLGYVGTSAARIGDREKGAKVSEQLAGLKTPYLFGGNTFWRGCIASISGDKESAMNLLRDALAQGVGYPRLYDDMDLENLRDYPPFRELIKPKG
jgi:tetratricopeptide (TPR) repeat protein